MLTGDYPFQEIYKESYIDELLDVIKNNRNLDEFIAAKDNKAREDFISSTEEKYSSSIAYYNQLTNEAKDKLSKLQEEKKLYTSLNEKIQEVVALYPEQKQELLVRVINNGGAMPSQVEELMKKPKGFIDRIRYNKKIEQANAKFLGLMKYCQDSNIFEKAKKSRLLRLSLSGENEKTALQTLNEDIVKIQEKIVAYEESKQKIQDKIHVDINEYDSTDKQEYRDIENNNIRQFVEQKGPYITNPPTISKEDIAIRGLSEEFIEGQVMQSRYADNVRSSVRRFYEGLDRPAAPMVAFYNGCIGGEKAQNEVIEKLRAKGINAVADTDEKAKDPTCFVVTKTSIQAPFLAPDEALKANVKMIEAICEAEHTDRPYLSNPLTREALIIAVEHKQDIQISMQDVVMNNGCNYQEITNGDINGYISSCVNEVNTLGISPNDLDKENSEAFNKGEAFKSIFHGGKCSSPYAVLCSEDNMNFVYGAGGACGDAHVSDYKYDGWHPDGALGYSIGKSTHNMRSLTASGIQYGFLFEYESRGDKQEFLHIDTAGGTVFKGGKFNREYVKLASSHDETTVLPHQNKLKKAYIVTRCKGNHKILPLDIDEKGEIKDKKWRDFMELHKPTDDNLKGNMIERRNNMIADYDADGKQKFMDRTLEDVNSQSLTYTPAEKKEFKCAESVSVNMPNAVTTMPPPSHNQGITPPPPPVQSQSMPPMPPPMSNDGAKIQYLRGISTGNKTPAPVKPRTLEISMIEQNKINNK